MDGEKQTQHFCITSADVPIATLPKTDALKIVACYILITVIFSTQYPTEDYPETSTGPTHSGAYVQWSVTCHFSAVQAVHFQNVLRYNSRCRSLV